MFYFSCIALVTKHLPFIAEISEAKNLCGIGENVLLSEQIHAGPCHHIASYINSIKNNSNVNKVKVN